jgi:hypothetical protein
MDITHGHIVSVTLIMYFMHMYVYHQGYRITIINYTQQVCKIAKYYFLQLLVIIDNNRIIHSNHKIRLVYKQTRRILLFQSTAVVRSLLLLKRRPHFKTHTVSDLGTNKNILMGHNGARNTRITLLTKTNAKLLPCSYYSSWSYTHIYIYIYIGNYRDQRVSHTVT